jgi:hypothetical protein
MAANEIHLEDIGTIFEITLKDGDAIVDLQLATTMEILFLPPNKVAVTQTAVHKTDGSDGIIQYTTLADDLDQVGRWKIQAHVILPAGEWKSDVAEFKVHSNLT